MRKLVAHYCLLYSALVLSLASCSIYNVKNEGDAFFPSLEHVEKMFATDDGPILGTNGESFIQWNLSLTMDSNDTIDTNSTSLRFLYIVSDTFAHYILARKELSVAVDEVCSLPIDSLQARFTDGILDVKLHTSNWSTSEYAVDRYDVTTKGWVGSQVFSCMDDDIVVTSSDMGGPVMEGQLVVRNPYGYLPSVLYGLFFFSGALMVGYLALTLGFMLLFCRYRDQLILLQYGILVVLLLGAATSATWYSAFLSLNETGDPLVPYPKLYLASVVMDAFLRTISRVLLLIVALGYGVVYNQLGKAHWLSIFLLSVLYCGSSVADHVYRGTVSSGSGKLQPTYWSFIELLCNLTFVMWIYISLEGIIKDLKTEKQDSKMKMYLSLSLTLAGFILFFSVLTIIAVSSRLGIFQWPVEWEWLQLVVWPVLNFTVSASICWLWRPTQSSSQYAFSRQLPMSEDACESDSDDGIEMIGTENFTIGEEDDDEEDHFAEETRPSITAQSFRDSPEQEHTSVTSPVTRALSLEEGSLEDNNFA